MKDILVIKWLAFKTKNICCGYSSEAKRHYNLDFMKYGKNTTKIGKIICKYSKILNTSCLTKKAKTNWADPNQTASSEAV